MQRRSPVSNPSWFFKISQFFAHLRQGKKKSTLLREDTTAVHSPVESEKKVAVEEACAHITYLVISTHNVKILCRLVKVEALSYYYFYRVVLFFIV